jgi:hypothetical protein
MEGFINGHSRVHKIQGRWRAGKIEVRRIELGTRSGVQQSGSTTRRPGGPSCDTDDPFVSQVRRGGGLLSCGTKYLGFHPPGRHLCRAHPAGREAARSAGQATKVELHQPQAIKALGLTVPLLGRTDEVLE